MGHGSVRAAIIYQHATTEADARIADSLDADIAGAVAGGGPETPPEDDRCEQVFALVVVATGATYRV